MNRQVFFEYLKTFVLTILAVLVAIVIFLAVIQHQAYEEQTIKQAQDETIDYYLVGMLVEKNKYLETQFPKNYTINLKLGILYDIEKDYKNAEIQFKKAIAKAPYDEYRPKYKLACFYIKLNRLDEAEEVIDSIKEAPNRRLIEYKGDVYNKLGDKYYDQSNYETAGLEYQKSLFYYQKINFDKIQTIKNSLASSYVYLADQKIRNMQIPDAINSLNEALDIVNAPILKYKLALMYMETKPDLAYSYFQEVFDKEPSLINYDTYYKFLTAMASDADGKGESAKGDLFRFKIKKLKEYYKSNILSVEDLSVEAADGKISFNPWSKKYNINIQFKLKNISEYNMNSLYVGVLIKDGGKDIDQYFNQMADKRTPFKAGAFSPTISFKAKEDQTKEDTYPKKVTALIFASKTETSYKIFLKALNISEQSKHKPHTIKLFGQEFVLPYF